MTQLMLRLRAARRLGTFKRAVDRGMSPEVAREYSDRLYPPTAADIAFEENLRNPTTDEPGFPWISALLYPVGAVIYISTNTPAPGTMILGYGLANLAYLLCAAAVFASKFQVFGLNKRAHVLIAAVALFCVGTVLSNLSH